MSEKEKKVRAESQKKQILSKLFKNCVDNDNYIFDNNDVRKVIDGMETEKKFGNHFDVTKVDRMELLPESIRKDGFALIHLGSGRHQFIKGLDYFIHKFEDIKAKDEIRWKYQKSLLNQYNESESNVLSVASNQGILNNFTFGIERESEDIDVFKRPKVYFPHRTKASLTYRVGELATIKLDKLQIEIDLTIEFEGTIAVFEAKIGKPDNFSVYQLYHPFLYYHEAKKKDELKDKIKNIVCVYVVKQKNTNKLKLWEYTFDDPDDITTLRFQKSACYNLQKEDE